ncbi:MAG TPA: thiamine phosphate synthase [Geminicoccaceae bacterium]|nr:thiamine phosphate synthase [Geminicoccaceae bacterium]
MSGVAKATGQETGAGCQVYLIGPPAADLEVLAPALEAALAAGDIVAFRLRAAAAAPETAQALQRICAGRVAFLLQDEVDLALALGADGVHLGDPTRVREARARLGPDRILGASCGGSRHAAMLAGEDGADYIAFGELGRPPRPELLELIEWWSELFVLPCLAEGAFDRGELERLAGSADFIGVSDKVWRHPDGAAAGVRSMLDTIAGA